MVAAQSQDSMRMFVYALCEPDGRTIRYIGVTADVWKRFKAHIGCCSSAPKVRDWIARLRENGLIPSLVILREVIGLQNGLTAEAEEIRARASDEGLLNDVHGRGKGKYRKGMIEFSGRSLTLSQWARELGISRQALNIRLNRHPLDVALSREKLQSVPLRGKRTKPVFTPTGALVIEVIDKPAVSLSHEQRRQRRMEMAKRLSGGLTREQVAVEFGVTTATVESARREFS